MPVNNATFVEPNALELLQPVNDFNKSHTEAMTWSAVEDKQSRSLVVDAWRTQHRFRSVEGLKPETKPFVDPSSASTLSKITSQHTGPLLFVTQL